MFNPIFNKRFGQLVVEERKRCDYTQAELAKKLKVSAQFLGRIEKGTPAPVRLVKKIVRILEIQDRYLCDMAAFAANDYCASILN